MAHEARDDHRLPESDPLITRRPEPSLDRVSYLREVVYVGRRASVDDAGLLFGWVHVAPARQRIRGHRPLATVGALRLAFYGRISTGEYQDPASSRAWQLDSARQTIAGRGRIVVEYFDVGCSRRLPWTERPEAAALLSAITRADRPFDAVVVGEYERAFHGNQLTNIAAALASYGVQLWLPETNGPVDLDNPTHQALMMLLGHQSNREILRARFRTTMAMTAQARDQSRHLGGRPPYGYGLVDAGPHPNAAHARWGRRLHRLDPDPVTAPHVQWIFAQRLAGSSAAAIARALNDLGVPCPSSHDPARNKHRHGDAWTLRTVAEILANPRYTGRQVWNRHRTDHHETVPGDKRTGRPQRHLPNPKEQWVISRRPAHPPLVSEQDFVTVQAITAAPRPDTDETRTYLLTGLLCCGLCDRLLDSHWVYRSPGYRCRHGHTSAHTPRPNYPKNIYVRQDAVIAFAARQLGRPADNPQRIADELRAGGSTIVCAPTGMTLAQPVEQGGIPSVANRT
jgi:site-specific DNA recombinase